MSQTNYIGLLELEKTQVSAMKRLSNNGVKGAENVYAPDEIKEKIEILIGVVDNGTSDFIDMRKNGKELFETFVEHCLIHSMTSINWRHKCYNDPISKMISIADEAMAMLLMENNALDLKEIKHTKQKLERSDQKSKHAKIDKEGDSGESFQGWHKKGLKCFNVLHAAVKKKSVT